MLSPIKVSLVLDEVATTKGYSVMSGPPNIFIILAGLLFLVAMSHASEENQIVPSNILEISPSIPEHSSKQIKDIKKITIRGRP